LNLLKGCSDGGFLESHLDVARGGVLVWLLIPDAALSMLEGVRYEVTILRAKETNPMLHDDSMDQGENTR